MSPIINIPGTSIYAVLKGSATLAPLLQPIFAAMWLASLVSNFGSLIQSVGVSWLMTSIAPSPSIVALVQSSMLLPILLFSVPAGAVADTWDRRLVMLIAQTIMLAVSAGLAILGYLGMMGPWALLGLTFLLGTGGAVFRPVWQASVRDLVPRQQIPAAVALNSLSYNVARTAGPALGGLIVAASGPNAAFLINAVCCVGQMVVIVGWRPPHTEQRLPPESMGKAMVLGLRYSALSPAIRAVLVRAAGFGFCGAAVWALLPVVALHIGGGPLTYGILLCSLGIGAIAGAFFTAPLRQRLSSESLSSGAVLVFAIATILAAFCTTVPPLVLCLAAIGATWILGLSIYNISIQMSSPHWVLGRTLAVYQMLAFGGMSLGSWIWGNLADVTSVSVSLGCSGLAVALTLLLCLRFRLPVAANPDLEPIGILPEPEVTLDFDPRNGPVVVSTLYRVRPENTDAFVSAMEMLRRVRRRDGWRNWMLLQDIAEPGLWTERYEAPTWLEYMRQNERATIADRDVVAVVQALHEGPDPPTTRYLLERPMVALGAKLPKAEAPPRATGA
jgi:MFS family permease